MQARATIIVEHYGNQWGAWFAASPQQSAGGEYPSDAICRLLELFTSELVFDVEEIAAIDSATADDHLEFTMPYQRLNRIPMPSVN